MTPEQHCMVLTQNHTEHVTAYITRLCNLLGRTEAEDLIALYWTARKNKYDHDTARTIVLVTMNLLPYEDYLRCYVLKSSSPFSLICDHGLVSDVPSGTAPVSSDTKDGGVAVVPESKPGENDE